MAERITFPQTGDNDDAEHFGSLIGQANLSDYIETGLDLQNYNAAGPDIDVTTGKCYISQSSETASSSGDTVLQTNSVVQIPATSALALTDSAVNEIYIDPDFGTDDNATVNATTTGVPSGSLKIGEVDTAADTVSTDFNREPSIVIDTITDRNGNTVYDGSEISLSRIAQGSGSGLDADTVDGTEAEDIARNYIWEKNHSTSFDESDITTNLTNVFDRGSYISLGWTDETNNWFFNPSDGGSQTVTRTYDATNRDTLTGTVEVTGESANRVYLYIDGTQVRTLFSDSTGTVSVNQDFSSYTGSTDVSIEANDRFTDNGDYVNVDATLTANGIQNTSGSATFTWSSPADVYEWDVATFTRTLDSETVDVFVAYNDGSGWTRTNSLNPISRNYSLSADTNISPSDNVRIEAELSRSTTSNDPQLNSIARSWII